MGNFALQMISAILQAAICSFFILTLERQVFNTRNSTVKNIIIIFLVLLAEILGTLLKKYIPLLAPITTYSLIFLIIKFILNQKLLYSFYIFISTIILLSVIEVISTFIDMIIFNADSSILLTRTSSTLVLLLLQTIIVFIITGIIILFTKRFETIKEFIIPNNDKKIMIILVLLAICTLPQTFIFSLTSYRYPMPLLTINTFQMILICFVIFIYFKEAIELTKAKSDLLTSNLHNKTMVSMVDGVRTLRHDYNNIIQALSGYIALKQYDKLQEHIDKILKECNIVNGLSLIDPTIFNEPAIYGIVGAKYSLATNNDISFDIDITTSIKDIDFPKPELSRILGILLDNAIEATNKTSNKYIRLEMKFDKRKCADYIRVINTFDTSVNINLDNIFNKGYSSKEVKSGIGLWEVKKIISKISYAQIYPSIEKDKFIQNIIIEKD